MRLAAAVLIAAAGTTAWVPEPPLGLDLHLPAPAINPLTREKAALGRQPGLAFPLP